jgi:hypothetical protein
MLVRNGCRPTVHSIVSNETYNRAKILRSTHRIHSLRSLRGTDADLIADVDMGVVLLEGDGESSYAYLEIALKVEQTSSMSFRNSEFGLSRLLT